MKVKIKAIHIFLLTLTLLFTFGFVYSASLPSKPYVSTVSEDEIVALSEEEVGFYAQDPTVDPMLSGPILPPDPGEEAPLGNWFPLLFLAIGYAAYIYSKQKRTIEIV